jgi:glucose/arabinose dehydrogenase
VNYTQKGDGTTVIAQYNISSTDSSVADPNSEQRILTQTQPFANHNGGGLAFGNDGFLYIGLGDGGGAGDPDKNAQNLGTFLGKFLRINVDATSAGKAYAVPSDNPFLSTSGAAPEIYAYGLRNPFRFSFDKETGALYAGDVGQNEQEEIDQIKSGGNYGWSVIEGNRCYPNGGACNTTGFTAPLVTYGRSEGQTVIGGYVYHGSLAPSLKGLYLFADFGSGTVWTLDPTNVAAGKSTLLTSSMNFSSFGQDGAGELYLLSYSDGKVFRFES